MVLQLFHHSCCLKDRREKVKIKSVELELVCGITSKLPDLIKPEIIFIGRSNVGKSSLINTLIDRKSYARVSAQPGKTQTINFYHINQELYFVDLPGYGYAKTSMQTREKWGKMIERYLQKPKKNGLLFLLLDIRHTPSKNDCMMQEWLQYYGYEPIIIATKADKIKKTQMQKQISQIRKTLALKEATKIIPFSALTKQGKDEIWNTIEKTLLVSQ